MCDKAGLSKTGTDQEMKVRLVRNFLENASAKELSLPGKFGLVPAAKRPDPIPSDSEPAPASSSLGKVEPSNSSSSKTAAPTAPVEKAKSSSAATSAEDHFMQDSCFMEFIDWAHEIGLAS